MRVLIDLPDDSFLAGLIIARGVAVRQAPESLARQLDELVAGRASEDFPPPRVKDAIRRMLRSGGFKPSGRNKPASEYLAQAAREGRFPRINNLVDINNLVSLDSGLPISMLDLEALGPSGLIRCGRAGENYVFNAAGQDIDLEGLVCICRREGQNAAGIPLGNPIKDSMAGKINEKTTGIVAVVYASTEAIDPAGMEVLVRSFAGLAERHAGATELECQVLQRS